MTDASDYPNADVIMGARSRRSGAPFLTDPDASASSVAVDAMTPGVQMDQLNRRRAYVQRLAQAAGNVGNTPPQRAAAAIPALSGAIASPPPRRVAVSHSLRRVRQRR